MCYLNKNIFSKANNFIQRGSKKFKQVVLAFFFSGLSTFAILYCVQPVLPIFSKNFMISPSQSSLSLSATTLAMAFGMLFTGPLSDFLGRKIIMTISLFIAAILTILCSMMNSWQNIILIRGCTGFALSGVAAVAISYLSEEMHPSALAFSIGLYISGNTLGGVFGRLISSVLTNYFSWKFALFNIGCFSLISAVFFFRFLPSSKHFKSFYIAPKHLFYSFFDLCRNNFLLVLCFIGFVIMGSFITIFNYVSYRLMLKPFFLSQNGISFLSTIYLIGVYSSPKAGMLIEKNGRKFILISALSLMIVGLIITQLNFLWFIILGLIIFSAGFFAAHSVSTSWISNQITIGKGRALSLYLFFYYLGSSLFGTFGGFFWLFFGWLGISILIILLLFIGIFLANSLV